MSDLYSSMYNPDVLTCLANLSSDEVFTPPDIANKMLDMLPEDIWHDSRATFLDPSCKSGVFLREIAKRLIDGLADEFPDLQERIDHIFHKQLFGIAITELTSLLSRRSLYCSKYPNSKYSISRFTDTSGNIRFKRIKHRWQNGKCIFCGASESEYARDGTLETHAYEWLHTVKPEEIFGMKFDVIIGNPPYQLDTGGSGKQAKPIYNLFVEQAKKLNPRFLSMIIPSRWFAGGMGLDGFRNLMMSDNRIRVLTDYANAKDCFPQNSISGGVCYFLWDRDYRGACTFTNISAGKEETITRSLSEFPVLVRYNKAVSILHKIRIFKETPLSEIVSAISPFGLSTKERGTEKRANNSDLILYSSAGNGYFPLIAVTKGSEYINSYKVMVSQTSAEHAGEPDKDGMFRVLTASMKVLAPGEICTHSYLVIGAYDNLEYANNLLNYLKSRFSRFLILMAISSIHISKTTFSFVPMQDFSRTWTDEELFEKYGLTDDEVSFIVSIIKPIE